MKTKFALSSLLIFTALLFYGCYKDKEELLYPEQFVDCDTSSVVSYTNHIVPIISNDCYGCHGSSNFNAAGGGLNLEGYANFELATKNGVLLQSIKRESGASPMPKGAPKLSDCKISQIEKWINQGALNN